MSRNAVEGCAAAGVALIALEREPWQAGEGDRWTHVPDLAGAVAALGEAPRWVFLAIGRQNLSAFAGAPQHHYLLRLVDQQHDLSSGGKFGNQCFLYGAQQPVRAQELASTLTIAQRAAAVSAAKVTIARAARFIGQNAVQLHGGMGMTEELKVSHNFRRLTMIAQRYARGELAQTVR